MNTLIKMLLGKAGVFLLSIIRQFREKQTIDKVMDLACAWVERLAGDTTKQPEEKRQAAYNGIKADLTSLRKSARDSLIFLAIELAYGALQAKRDG